MRPRVDHSRHFLRLNQLCAQILCCCCVADSNYWCRVHGWVGGPVDARPIPDALLKLEVGFEAAKHHRCCACFVHMFALLWVIVYPLSVALAQTRWLLYTRSNLQPAGRRLGGGNKMKRNESSTDRLSFGQ